MDLNPWERRQKILEVLCLRRHETTGNLAHEFNAAVTTLYRFNRIGASQNDKVPVNGSPANVKLMSQVASSLMPPEAKYLQNSLAAFPRVHVHSRKSFHRKLKLSFLSLLLVLTFTGQTVSSLTQMFNVLDLFPHSPHFLIICVLLHG